MGPGRENTAGRIAHPETVDGRQIWLDPEVEDMIHKLHYGDATMGWEGDPALALYRTLDGRWELWRLENDGEYRRFCRSAPGAKLDNRLIMELVAHDARRGYNPHTALVAHNERLERERERKDQERTSETLQKVYHALGKDIGYHYG